LSKCKIMEKDTAIKAEHISKTFLVPREKGDTFREHLLHIRKKNRYESFHALQDVSFEIRKGEFFGIIGKNGSGKSTLLKILAGIYTPDKGNIVINGGVSPFIDLGVGFNPELSGRDNIHLKGTLLGLSGKEIRAKFDSIVDFSELGRFIDQKLKNYSGGMQVRLAFSVAIHANKDILLLDEVLAVGDASFQLKCFEVFEKIIKSGKTILFVSHDTVSMQKYAGRVLYLEAGKPSFTGTSNEALSRYMYADLIKDPGPAPAREIVVKTDQPGITGQDVSTVQAPQTVRQVVDVLEIKFYENDGQEKSMLTNGNQLKIRVTYEVKRDLEDLIFGIIIRDHLHRDLFVTNTLVENVITGGVTPGRWLVSFEMPNFFSAGKYSVSPAVCDKTQRIFYDWKDDFAFFHVRDPRRVISYGGFDLPHTIKIKKDKI
jgi:ABC-type polysaccharide/polyol phosphate transport system ATPase subunit